MARTQQGEIRSKILDAARERMHHFGFKKTTIDEIAADAGVGKGTVYLYFESKEDVALAILVEFKERTNLRMREIAEDSTKTLSTKLTEMLSFPILEVQESCNNNPGSLDILLSIRPHIQARLKPYFEEENSILAGVLEQGNRQGLLDVPNTTRAARSLKLMVKGFFPPYPCISEPDEVREEVGNIVDLAIRGMCAHNVRDRNIIK